MIGLGLGLGFSRGASGPAIPAIQLSNASVLDNAANGSAVGTLTVSNGTGSYTFTEIATLNSSFAVASNGAVTTTGTLSVGTSTLNVSATNGTDTLTHAFTMTVASSADTTAPTLSSPADAASGATGASLSVSTNEANGTLYWYVSTSATAPSAANLKTGTGAVSSGSQAVSATGTQSATAGGLSASTAYFSYFLHRDAAGNDSAIAAADGFTTGAAGSGTAKLFSGGIGSSNEEGNNQIDDLAIGYKFFSTKAQFAIGGSGAAYVAAGAVQTGQTVGGQAGPYSETSGDTNGFSGAVSSASGIIKSMIDRGLLDAVAEYNIAKAATKGQAATGMIPGGGTFGTYYNRMMGSIATSVAAGNAQWVFDKASYGGAEAQAASSAAETATGSTAQAVVMPVALGAADPATGTGTNPLYALQDSYNTTRRKMREFHGVMTAPFFIVGPVLPLLSGGTYANNAQRTREATYRMAANVCRWQVDYDAATGAITKTDLGANRFTTSWNTATDKPIFTDSGVADPQYDANSYLVICRGVASGDDLHYGADASMVAGKAIDLPLQDIYGAGVPGTAISAIRPIHWVDPYIEGSVLETSATVNLQASAVGTAYLSLYTGSTVPTEAQVVAGTGTGFVATLTATTRSKNTIATAPVFTGLTASTAYKLYSVIEVSGVRSVVSVPLSFTTAAAVAGAPSFFGQGTRAAGTGSVTAALPASTAANDIAVVIVTTSGLPVTTPSGYTAITGSPFYTGDAGDKTVQSVAQNNIYWKRLGSSETGPTFADASTLKIAAAFVFRGCVTSGTPFEILGNSNTNGAAAESVTSYNLPGGTTTGVNGLVVSFASTGRDNVTPPFASGLTNASLSGLVKIGDDHTSTGDGAGWFVTSGVKASAGTVGTTAVTFAAATGVAAVTIALKPA